MDSLSGIVNIWVGFMKYTHLWSSGNGGGAARGAWVEDNAALIKMVVHYNCLNIYRMLRKCLSLAGRRILMDLSLRPALNKRSHGPSIPRVWGRARRETQCKNAEVNKECLSLRNRWRDRTCKDVRGGERRERASFKSVKCDKLVYSHKLRFINTFATHILLHMRAFTPDSMSKKRPKF